jgi:hypothetical protein
MQKTPRITIPPPITLRWKGVELRIVSCLFFRSSEDSFGVVAGEGRVEIPMAKTINPIRIASLGRIIHIFL